MPANAPLFRDRLYLMKDALLERVIAGEGTLVLERLSGHRFRVVGIPPSWTELLLYGELERDQEVNPVELFVFLEHFLKDAEVTWNSAEGTELTSEPWTETLVNREELAFSATARKIDGHALLLVRGLGVDFEERCRVLRKARELALAHERLLKETSEKEALLHCLVHDVAGPLATAANCFRLLEAEENLSEAGRKLVTLGGSATHRQHTMVREMLDLFAAELSALEDVSHDAASAPEILDCAHSVLRSLRYSFEVKGVSFELLLSPPANPIWKVVGHRERLERVIYNLLDNALGHAPVGSTVTLRLEDEGEAIRVSVVDQGQARDFDSANRIPGRLWRSDDSSAKLGIGLIFCRAMIQQWSGEIGHEPGPRGGACIWFRLAKPGISVPRSASDPLEQKE